MLAEAFADLWYPYLPLRSIQVGLKLRQSQPVKENASHLLGAVKEEKTVSPLPHNEV